MDLATMVNVSVLHIHPLSRSGLGSSKMFALAGMSLDLATRLFVSDMKEKVVRIYIFSFTKHITSMVLTAFQSSNPMFSLI